MIKICGTCKVEKELSDFSLKNGKPQYNCKQCHSAYRKKHYQENKQKYIEKSKVNRESYRRQYYEWLSTQHCLDCGIDDIRVLEQDHLFDKKFNISEKIGGRNLAGLMEELKKCETVCANCHKIRTATRGNFAKNFYATVV